jgi:hypothetical protein
MKETILQILRPTVDLDENHPDYVPPIKEQFRHYDEKMHPVRLALVEENDKEVAERFPELREDLRDLVDKGLGDGEIYDEFNDRRFGYISWNQMWGVVGKRRIEKEVSKQ